MARGSDFPLAPDRTASPEGFATWRNTHAEALRRAKSKDIRLEGRTGWTTTTKRGTTCWHWYRPSAHRPVYTTVGEYVAEASKEGGGALGDTKFRRMKALAGHGDSVVRATARGQDGMRQVFDGRAHFTRGAARIMQHELAENGSRVVNIARSNLSKQLLKGASHRFQSRSSPTASAAANKRPAKKRRA
jgi:hypothetical protein